MLEHALLALAQSTIYIVVLADEKKQKGGEGRRGGSGEASRDSVMSRNWQVS